MPTAVRERVISAPSTAVWEVIADPHHMPRWWPKVVRMEGVETAEATAGERFTQVFVTRRGRSVRADFHVVASDPPWRRAWEQDVPGTPFERVLSESVIEMTLEPVPEGTHVTLAQRQTLRGYSRTGGLLVRRASGDTLAEALEGLSRLFEPEGP